MSSPQSDEEFTTDELLKFLTFVMRAHQEEYDANVTVDSDLLNAIIMAEHEGGMNLIIEQDDGRTVVRAELNES